MTDNKYSELRRILVFRIGHLGDTIVALPAFWTLRKTFPNAKLTLLSNEDPENPHYISPRNVLPEKGLFDSYLSYPNRLANPLSALKLAGQIRLGRFDAVFYLMPRGRSPKQIVRDKKFFRLAGIDRQYCFSFAAANHLPVQVTRPLPNVTSEAQYLIDSLASESVAFEGGPPKNLMALTEGERVAADRWFAKSVRISSDRFVAIGPKSKWTSKTWDEDRFAKVTNRLIGECGVFPIVFGGKEDRSAGDWLIEQWGIGANAAGELDVRTAAAALSRCSVYLGNDTGTMHLAASVGTPCVALFSAVDWPGRWHPIGTGHKIFRRRVECEGCGLSVSAHGNKCLRLIEPEEVLEACREVLMN